MEHYELKFIIELDPLQQLHRLFMVYQKYTRKLPHVGLCWHPMTVFTYECAFWPSEILIPFREHPSNIKALLILSRALLAPNRVPIIWYLLMLEAYLRISPLIL